MQIAFFYAVALTTGPPLLGQAGLCPLPIQGFSGAAARRADG